MPLVCLKCRAVERGRGGKGERGGWGDHQPYFTSGFCLKSCCFEPAFQAQTHLFHKYFPPSTASELILEWGYRRGEARRAKSGVWVLGEGQPAPPHQMGVPTSLRERCKLPQRGPGRSPGRRRVFLYSEPSDCLSQHHSTCCIQFAWLGITFF